MKINKTFYMLTALALLLGASLWLAGCESDTVAPHEELPALTLEDKAFQAGAMGAAAGRVLPQIVEFSGNKNEYSYSFPNNGGDISGDIYFDFRLGSADGTSADYNVATWGRMYTADDEPIAFAIGQGGSVEVDFNIMASIDAFNDTATLLDGSVGTFTAGEYIATFAFDGVVVTAGDSYPSGGTMTFVTAGTELVVAFDGDNTATVSLDGVLTWVLDLDDGSVTEVS